MAESDSLGAAAWPEIGSPIVLIPVGSTEQHGPHLPLDTDTRIAMAVADSVATDGRLIGPALAITASGEHDGFPGTLSIGTDVMRDLVVELVRSARWASSIVLVNGHGGNHEPVTAAVAMLSAEGHRVSAWWPDDVSDLAGINAREDLHAGRIETSVMLNIAPEVVRAEAIAPGSTVDIADLRADGVALHSPSGVIGDPSGATAELGQAILARWSASLERHIGQLG
jgi:mycofactocin system creatininase family protein